MAYQYVQIERKKKVSVTINLLGVGGREKQLKLVQVRQRRGKKVMNARRGQYLLGTLSGLRLEDPWQYCLNILQPGPAQSHGAKLRLFSAIHTSLSVS